MSDVPSNSPGEAQLQEQEEARAGRPRAGGDAEDAETAGRQVEVCGVYGQSGSQVSRAGYF